MNEIIILLVAICIILLIGFITSINMNRKTINLYSLKPQVRHNLKQDVIIQKEDRVIQGLEKEWVVLLEKYMYHIILHEGSSFVNTINKNKDLPIFSKTEVESLKEFDNFLTSVINEPI